ncbi:MAG: glycosyltransferase [Planctomycetota bacterium]|nr:MAG: glycosyltransferase [Planctomycetota bacterium]
MARDRGPPRTRPSSKRRHPASLPVGPDVCQCGAVIDVALLAEGLDPRRGGAERAVRAVAAALARNGLAVAVYAPQRRLGPPLAGVRAVGVSLPRLPRPLWAAALARRLRRRARADGAARVVACGKLLGADAFWPHGGVHAAAREAAAQAGRRRAALARLGRRLRASEFAYDAIEARCFAACRRGQAQAIALSERVRRDMQRWHGLAPEEIRVVRNGADPERFAPPTRAARGEARRALARRAGARGDATLALFVGHSFRLKGLDLALRAVAPHPGVHLVVAGGDDPRPYAPLARECSLEGRLSFLGPVRDVAPLYRGASFLLHPSRYDPCSLVVTEALASGLPVVASARDGASEHLRQGRNGYVVRADEEPQAFADFVGLLDDPALQRLLAEGAAAFRRPWSEVGRELLAAAGSGADRAERGAGA